MYAVYEYTVNGITYYKETPNLLSNRSELKLE